MQIFVETLTGRRCSAGGAHSVGKSAYAVEASSMVEDVKSLIQEKEGVAVAAQRLLFAGKQLEDSCSLAEYNVQEESTLTLALRLIGGGKVHGSLTRAGKVRNQTPKVEKQEKGKSHVGEGDGSDWVEERAVQQKIRERCAGPRCQESGS